MNKPNRNDPWEKSDFSDKDLDSITDSMLDSVDVDALREGETQAYLVSVALIDYETGARKWGNANLTGLPDEIMDSLDILFRMIGKAIVDSGCIPIAAFFQSEGKIMKLNEETEEQDQLNVVAVMGHTHDGRSNAGFVTIPSDESVPAQISFLSRREIKKDPNAKLDVGDLPLIFESAKKHYNNIVLKKEEKEETEASDNSIDIVLDRDLINSLFQIDNDDESEENTDD